MINISEKRQYLPLRIYWDITEKCPLNCIHCYLDKNLVPDDRNKSLKILKNCIDGGVIWFSFSGAEPLSCDYIFEIIEIIKSKGLIFDLATSTVPLNNKHIFLLKKFPPRFIQVSLDGTKERHNRIRGGNYFDIVIENIKKLKSIGIEVVIAATLIDGLAKDIPKLLDLLNDIEVDAFRLRLYIPNQKQDLIVPKEEYYSLVLLLKEYRKKVNFNIMDLPFEFCISSKNSAIRSNPACGFCFNTISVTRNGDIVPCISLKKKTVLGNILNSSLVDIWRSEKMNAFREEFTTLPVECYECNLVQYCFGECKACTYALFQRFDRVNPYCLKNVS